MARQLVRRFLLVFLCIMLLGASGIFVYQVSPLRDPSFQANGTMNAGTLVPWLQNLSEKNWKFGAAILAAILATMLTVLLTQWCQPLDIHTIERRQRRSRGWLEGFNILWIGIWIVFFTVLWLASVAYLLNQWMID